MSRLKLDDEISSFFKGGTPTTAAPRPGASAMEQNVAALVSGALAKARNDSGLQVDPATDFVTGSPFHEILIDLNDTQYRSGVGPRINIQGYGLFLRKWDANPTTELSFQASGPSMTIVPGMFIKARFKFFNIAVQNGFCVKNGGTKIKAPSIGGSWCYLSVLTSPDVQQVESYMPSTYRDAQLWDLTPGACTLDWANAPFAGVIDTYPTLVHSGQANDTLLNVSKLKTIRVQGILKHTAVGDATFKSLDVFPIETTIGDGLANLNLYTPTAKFTLGDSGGPTITRFSFEYDCTGVEELGFYFANLSGGSAVTGDTVYWHAIGVN